MTGFIGYHYPAKIVFTLLWSRTHPSNENYENVLENEISKIFPRSNRKPTIKIICRGQVKTKDFRAYSSINDSLILNAETTIDEDTPHSLLKFSWQQINKHGEEGISPAKRLSFNNSSSIVKLTFPKTGMYYIRLVVEDGVSQPQTINIEIEVINEIEIKTNRRNFYLYRYASMFWFPSKKFFFIPLVCESKFNIAVLDNDRFNWRNIRITDLQEKDSLDLYLQMMSDTTISIIPDVSNIIYRRGSKSEYGFVYYFKSKFNGIRSNRFQVSIDYNGVVSNKVACKHHFILRSPFTIRRIRVPNDILEFKRTLNNGTEISFRSDNYSGYGFRLKILPFLEGSVVRGGYNIVSSLGAPTESTFHFTLPSVFIDLNGVIGIPIFGYQGYSPIIYLRGGITFCKRATVTSFNNGNPIENKFPLDSKFMSIEVRLIPKLPIFFTFGYRRFDGRNYVFNNTEVNATDFRSFYFDVSIPLGSYGLAQQQIKQDK